MNNAFAGIDEFDGLFTDIPVGKNDRWEINTDEHGKVVAPFSEPSVRNIVRQQKTSKAVSVMIDVRTNFKSVVV